MAYVETVGRQEQGAVAQTIEVAHRAGVAVVRNAVKVLTFRGHMPDAPVGRGDHSTVTFQRARAAIEAERAAEHRARYEDGTTGGDGMQEPVAPTEEVVEEH